MSDCDCKDPDPPVCDPVPRKTYCDKDRRNNVWIDGGNRETGEGGVCILDNLNESQLEYILERDEIARRDLVKVTTDPWLLNKAATVQRLPTTEEMDALQVGLNRQKDTIPFYTAFAGKPPFAQ